MSDGGKGSAPRPFSVSSEEYSKNWDAIFRRKNDDVQNVLSERDEEAPKDTQDTSQGRDS